MRKKILLILVTCSLVFCLPFAGLAITINTGALGVKFTDYTYTDFNYATLAGGNSGLPPHPAQTPGNESGHVWGIFSVSTIHSLLDNNPENTQLSGLPYYATSSDGKVYFGVYGGLALLSDTGNIPGQLRLEAASGGVAYLKIYEVDVAYADAYDAAYISGPNVSGAGSFASFGQEIIYGPDKVPGNADDPVLWLDTVFSPRTLQYYDALY